MNSYKILPDVNKTQEFIEIANDFANPLDLVREAISNAFDASANEIKLLFDTEQQAGETIFVIRLEDNGTGMGKDELQAFFDLGNSTRKNDKSTIGEKGHGTKIYFNAKRVVVETQKNGIRLEATLNAPFQMLHNGCIPEVDVREINDDDSKSGTRITIYGYNNNRRERFTHSRLRDHILWFTKFGSIESQFGIDSLINVKLSLKGLDSDRIELLEFGHKFPKENYDIDQIFDQHTVSAPDHYSRRIVKNGSLPRFPEIRYNAVFSIEGKHIKYSYNSMLRRSGHSPPDGAYTMQERYGLWLCKDYIPVQRKNEWITSKGSEYTKLHAFFNCQNLRLTANRGSIDNTPAEILQDIEEVIKKVYKEITESEDWLQLSYLEEEAYGYNTVEKEKRNFRMRLAKANKTNIAKYKNTQLVEPQRESGVYGLTVQLLALEPSMFPFVIVDYDTHEGIDVIAKDRNDLSINASKLYYVEFKNILTGAFNHSFENQHSIVCWDTELKHGGIVKDVNNEERKLLIVPPANSKDYTRYFLEHPRKANKIEIFVLKYYLYQKFDIRFQPRTEEDTC